MGASVDLLSEGLRRALVNACYWGLNLEDKIPAASNVEIVGTYQPTFYGFGVYRTGVKPSDHQLPPTGRPSGTCCGLSTV